MNSFASDTETNRTILFERELSGFDCRIVAADPTESEQRVVKALRWLLEDSQRDDNREVD